MKGARAFLQGQRRQEAEAYVQAHFAAKTAVAA